MKYSTILLIPILTLSMLLITCTSRETPDENSGAMKSKEVYTCPMHPTVIRDRPGDCPVCGMALVRRSEQKEMTAEEQEALRAVSLSPAQRIMANIVTVPAEQRVLARQVNAVGVVDFAEPLQAWVSARFRGRVDKLLVSSTGAAVRKGQPLLEMYSPELFTAQQEYLSSLAGSRTGAAMQEQLAASGREQLHRHYGLSDEQISAIERTGKPLPTISFLAPISGTVIRKQVVEGQYVDEGASLYQLADLSRVWVYLEVSELDVRFISVGQVVKLSTDVYPGETIQGRVSFIDPTITAETRSVRVRTEIPNPGGKLKPQMYMRAVVETRAGSSVTVPVDAVVQTGRRSVVWVEVSENMFEPRDVVLGNRSGGYYEITSGLMDGEMVAATGGFLLDSESLLQSPASAASADGAMSDVHAEASQEMSNAENSRGESGSRPVRVTVDAKYSPAMITAVKGQPLSIAFFRRSKGACSEEVVFKDFGIRKPLALNKETMVTFTPDKRGTFRFTCGMNMMEGTLVVK